MSVAPARGRVRIVAPSSPFDEDTLARGVTRLEAAGFVVDAPSPPRPGPQPFLNGDDAARAQELREAFASDADIIWAARGGYGLTRLLPLLDDELFVTDKTYVGFSDNTALFARFFKNAPGRAIHGPLATSVGTETEAAFAHLCAVLDDDLADRSLPATATLCEGASVTGPAMIANLCVLTHLVGTPWFPALDGAILCVEEVGERPYRLDRMWTQLLTAGVLDGVAGVALGHLTGCDDAATPRAPAIAALDICRERLAPLGIPVIAGLPFGHEHPNYAIPVGNPVTLHTGTLRGLALAP